MLRGSIPSSELASLTGKEARKVLLGHLLRGGTPTSFDRLLLQRIGAASVRALDHGQSGIMVVLDPPTVNYVPLDHCDTILTARTWVFPSVTEKECRIPKKDDNACSTAR